MSDDNEYGNSIIHKSIILFILGLAAIFVWPQFAGHPEFGAVLGIITIIAGFLFLIWGISLRRSSTQSASSGFSFWSFIMAIVASVIAAFIYSAMTGK